MVLVEMLDRSLVGMAWISAVVREFSCVLVKFETCVVLNPAMAAVDRSVMAPAVTTAAMLVVVSWLADRSTASDASTEACRDAIAAGLIETTSGAEMKPTCAVVRPKVCTEVMAAKSVVFS